MNAYLDNSATTRPSEAVRRAVAEALESGWYNPSALYTPALEAQKRIDAVRADILKALGARNHRVIFTAGGTEADNLAVLGTLKGHPAGRRVLISAVEHPAIAAMREEIQRMGFSLEEMPVDAVGRVDLDRLEAMLDGEVALIAVMQVNNETGTVQPLAEIAALRDRLCPEAALHVDGVQGFLRVPLDLRSAGIQSYALSGHKIQGIKGIGALVVQKNHPLKPLVYGGGQEGGERSGTENTPGIIALGEAVRAYDSAVNQRMRGLKLRLWEGIRQGIPGAVVNGPVPEADIAAPHILNMALEPVRSQTMLFALEGDGIYVSAGSACASRKQKISPVLKAMGISTARADCSLRFSLSPDTSAEEIDYAVERVNAHYEMLKKYTRR